MKVAISMIVFNSDEILEAALESAYSFASQIVITEGPVGYYIDRGFTTSTDNTVEIIRSFPDPEKKITLIQGQWPEKTEMMKAQTEHVHPDTDFAWMVDADEVYKAGDAARVLEMLPEYDSVGFRSLSFYGNFETVLTGFEQMAEYQRIQRWTRWGWHRHRTPTILNPESGQPWRKHRHLNFEHLAARGIHLYHYTYVFPSQFQRKIGYISEGFGKGKCIDGYYENVYLRWIRGDEATRQRIEDKFNGVHEFLPKLRGACRTAPFTGTHPEAIEKRLSALNMRLQNDLLAI